MYAIIETGGKQIRVEEGAEIFVEKLPAEAGEAVEFDKVLLIYMPSTYEFSDCLSTYTYRMAFGSSNDFGLSTASGLFQSVVGTILMVGGNKLSAMTTKHSMF